MNGTTTETASTFYRDMFRLALPIVMQNLITTAVSSADVVMLGFVSQSALAAGSLASQIMFILNLVYTGFSSESLCWQHNTGERKIPIPSKKSWESVCGSPF